METSVNLSDRRVGASSDARQSPWPNSQYCEFMKMTPAAAAQQRYKGTGPRFIRAGSRIYYDPEDVYAWLDGNKVVRTDGAA